MTDMLQNCTDIDFADPQMVAGYKAMMKNLFTLEPDLMRLWPGALENGVKENVITDEQATLLNELTNEVIDELFEEAVSELSKMLGVDLKEIIGAE